MMTQTGFQTNRARQRGAALIVSLLILLVMTLLGVTSMQTTVLEERMASNARDKQLAFQAAEAALREGERWFRDIVAVPEFSGSGGRYQPDNDRWKTLDWSTDSNVIIYPDNASNESIGQVAAQPRYYLEELPPAKNPGDSMVQGYEPNQGNPAFRITARGVGGSATAITILQSTYVR